MPGDSVQNDSAADREYTQTLPEGIPETTPDVAMEAVALQAMWEALRNGDGSVCRDQLIGHYLPYARIVAACYFRRRLHDEIEFAEYVQLASLALVESIDRFDPSCGVEFRTYASRRMHGAILNGLEIATEKQRQIAFRRQLKAERLASLKHRDNPGRAPSKSPDKLFLDLADIGIGLALAYLLEGTGMIDAPDAASEGQGYYRRTELRQLRQKTCALMNSLPDQQRTVVRCHYVQELSFSDIADMLGLSKGRIAQIHRQALKNLRDAMQGHGDLDICL